VYSFAHIDDAAGATGELAEKYPALATDLRAIAASMRYINPNEIAPVRMGSLPGGF
jgi:hypothetical protein